MSANDAAGPDGPRDPVTAVAIAAAVRDGAARPERIVEAALERIRLGDPKINAFSLVRAERAADEARALADRPDLDSLPLAGVPIAVKNNIDVAGEVTRGVLADDLLLAIPKTRLNGL